jgi:hypothetical protein
MNTDTQPITPELLTIGHTVKDAPATCFLMLALAGGQARETWLARVTGYALKTVHVAVETLDVLGLAARIGQHKAWVLTSKARQLAAPLDLPVSPDEIQNRVQGTVLITTSTTVNDLVTLTPKVVAEEENQNREQRPVLTEPEPEYEAALQALHRNNIKGETAEGLARSEWVTPEYVDAIMEDTARRGLPRWQTRALAIKRMRDADEAEPPESAQGETVADAWRNYTNCPMCKQTPCQCGAIKY